MLEEVPTPMQQQRPQQEIRKTGQSVHVLNSSVSDMLKAATVVKQIMAELNEVVSEKKRVCKIIARYVTIFILTNSKHKFKNSPHPATPYQLIAPTHGLCELSETCTLSLKSVRKSSQSLPTVQLFSTTLTRNSVHDLQSWYVLHPVAYVSTM
jgi:hypothetical protein